jgi:hypothetical protein
MNLSRDFAHQHDKCRCRRAGLRYPHPKGQAPHAAEDFRPRTGPSQYGGQHEISVLSGFIKTVKSITTTFPSILCALFFTLEAKSGYDRQLADALEMLRDTHSQKILNLLPANIKDVTNEEYIWPHDAIQRELDYILAKAHDDLYDLTRIEDQQDKATLLSTDTSIFALNSFAYQMSIPYILLSIFSENLTA